jgi:hypothetical protein
MKFTIVAAVMASCASMVAANPFAQPDPEMILLNALARRDLYLAENPNFKRDADALADAYGYILARDADPAAVHLPKIVEAGLKGAEKVGRFIKKIKFEEEE